MPMCRTIEKLWTETTKDDGFSGSFASSVEFGLTKEQSLIFDPEGD